MREALAFGPWLSLAVIASTAQAEVVFDFESGDLQGWQIVEGQFAQVVSDRATFHNRPEQPYNKQGRYFLSTLEMPDGAPNDGQVGTILSPVFRLDGPQMTLLVGGGAHADTVVALCTEDGNEVLLARGRNDEPMQRITWDAGALVGQKVFVKVLDHNTGPWGHATLDDFRARGEIDADATAALMASFAERERERLEKQMADRERRMAELTDESTLFARGEQTVYAGERLTAISLPVGGIGAGSIEIDGRGVRRLWHIFNNFAAASVPESFFAVRAQADGREPVVRRLETAEGAPFAPMAGLTFRGEYPFGWFDFEDPALPVKVSLETFNPVIPLDARRSAIPCAFYTLTAENPGPETVEVAFIAAQLNAVGYIGEGAIEGRRHPAFGGNRNRVLRDGDATILHMTSDLPSDAPGAGDMALMALADATAVSEVQEWSDEVWDVPGEEVRGPSPAGETLTGALVVRAKLAPGARLTVPFVLTWHFPNVRHGQSGWGGYGNRYAAWWDSALEVARYVQRDFGELARLTRLYRDTLYESNLPVWLLDRISSQVAVLKSNTVFWSKSGYFGGWEGCNEGGGCCAGNCSHVWHYAQAHARLFPELARAMREQEFRHQLESGLIPFRQALMTTPAGDSQAGAVLNTYREHLASPNGEWLGKHWPAAKRAMDFHIAAWDADEDGMLAGAQHNTLDADSSGTSSWLGSMYLAALAAAERMAQLEGDGAAAERYGRIREAGETRQNEALWNGEYYMQVPQAPLIRDYGNGCHIDQVLGQWWAHQLDLGWVYPQERVRAALEALFRYSFRADFHGIPQAPRKFVADEDAGMQMITWPLGGRPEPEHCMMYADEVMSGFEYSAAAAMVQAGLLREAFALVHAAWLRYDGRLRADLPGGAWGYSGNPFCDDECGKFYARPMSIWSMLTACQGFIYDGPAGIIGFRPMWKPEDHRSMFTAAEGWGLFTQTRAGGRQTERIEVRAGQLRVRTLVFEVPEGTPETVSVRVAGEPVPSTHRMEGRRLTISLEQEITAKRGEAIEVLTE